MWRGIERSDDTLNDGVVWICACIDPIDDGIERVS
jgi:hypothetical protein